MRLRLEMRCGHVIEVDAKRVLSPSCPMDGERRVSRTLNRPAPSFTGHGSGPFVRSKRLKAVPVNLAPAGPLKRKRKQKSEDD